MQAKWLDDSFLDAMRQETDPLADGLVAALFDELGPDGVGAFHGGLIRSDETPADGLPPPLRRLVQQYLEESSRLPDWADLSVVDRADQVLRSFGPATYTVLACASLPECYVDWRGVPVLYMSHKLAAHVHRRVVETAQFTMGVMSSGGFLPGGRGVLAAQKVRLMHATMRRLTLLEPPASAAQENLPDIAAVFRNASWTHDLGKPINQEDLAYTLLTFSWVIVRGLRTLECSLKPEDEEAVIHAWNLAGRFMGIRDDLLPNSVAEAERMFTKLKSRLAGESAEGKALLAALLDFLWTACPLRPLPVALLRGLVGDATADMLGAPSLSEKDRAQAEKWVRAVERVNHLESGVLATLPLLRRGAESMSDDLLDHLMKMPRGGERCLFELPTHLAIAWNRQDAED